MIDHLDGGVACTDESYGDRAVACSSQRVKPLPSPIPIQLAGRRDVRLGGILTWAFGPKPMKRISDEHLKVFDIFQVLTMRTIKSVLERA